MSGGPKVLADGVIVGRSASGEGSARIYLYTEALGLVSALAKSAREERSQLRAHLQPGTLGVFSLVKGRDVWRVAGVADTENIFFALEDRARKETLARVLAFVRQFVRDEGADPYLFSVLRGFVASLPSLTDEDVRRAEKLAVVRMLSALGYVEAGVALAPFLGTAYEPAMLENADRNSRELLRAINEGISASGLA